MQSITHFQYNTLYQIPDIVNTRKLQKKISQRLSALQTNNAIIKKEMYKYDINNCTEIVRILHRRALPKHQTDYDEGCFAGWEEEMVQNDHLTSTDPTNDQDKYLNALNEHMLTMNMMQEQEVDNSLPIPPSNEEWAYQKAREGFFPPLRDPYTKLRTIEQLKELLQIEQKKFDRQDIKYFYRHFNRPSTNIITVLCRNCRNCENQQGKKKMGLTMDKTTGFYNLKYFQNGHNHHYHDTVVAKKKGHGSIMKVLKKQFESAPKDMHLAAFVADMMKKYSVGQKVVRHFLYHYKRMTENFKQVVDLASITGAKFWFKNKFQQSEYLSNDKGDQMEQQPQLFIFSFAEMFERFKAVGQVCYVMMMEFKLRGNEGRQWKIITMSGLTLGYIMEPFLFGFIEWKYADVKNLAAIFAKIFQWFQLTPNVIITPSDEIYTHITSTMKNQKTFKGLHLFDPIIQIDRIGASLEKYQDLIYFKNVILCRTKVEYNKNIQKLLEKCQPTKSIRSNLNRILKYSHKMCFSCIQSMGFIGTIFDFSANKLISEVISQNMLRHTLKSYSNRSKAIEMNEYQQFITNEYNKVKKNPNIKGTPNFQLSSNKVIQTRLKYTRCVKSLMNIMRRSIVKVDNTSNYDLKPYETVIELPDMVAIRRCIKTNLFAIFGEQYGKIYYLDYFQRTSKAHGELKVYDMYDRTAKTLFVVGPEAVYCEDGSLQKIVFRCNCLFSYKSGIPCAHEILATMLTKSSLFTLFKKDYIVSQKYKRSGRPKLTHRNTEK